MVAPARKAGQPRVRTYRSKRLKTRKAEHQQRLTPPPRPGTEGSLPLVAPGQTISTMTVMGAHRDHRDQRRSLPSEPGRDARHRPVPQRQRRDQEGRQARCTPAVRPTASRCSTASSCDVLALPVELFMCPQPPLHRLQFLGRTSSAAVMLELDPPLTDAHLREFGRADPIHLEYSSRTRYARSSGISRACPGRTDGVRALAQARWSRAVAPCRASSCPSSPSAACLARVPRSCGTPASS